MQARNGQLPQHPQIAGPFQQRAGLPLDLFPVRLFRRDDGVAVLLLGLALRDALKGAKGGVEFEIGAGGRVLRHHPQQRSCV